MCSSDLLRPDLNIVTFRGNVQTRLRKLDEGLADATFLAMAGLNRLGHADIAKPIPITDMLPAAAQGIIGVVTREDADADLRAALARLNVAASEASATAERAFLALLDGSCRTPIAAHLSATGEGWHLAGEVLSPDGKRRWRAEGRRPKTSNLDVLAALGREVASEILESAQGQLPAFENGK